MRVLNLYAGIGGNRKLWPVSPVTAVESDPAIASVYKRQFPGDQVVIGDAHQYLTDHFSEFDFIWSSPPCQTHSKMNKATRHKSARRYFDAALWQQIVFLQSYFSGKWVVENVVPYYEPLIEPTAKVGRHLFWSNFKFEAQDVPRPNGFIDKCNLAGKQEMMDWLGIHYPENIYYNGNHCPAQILRNAVHPNIGKQIFDTVLDATPARKGNE
jgi:DNA (cytosine-5)-methyltransferase 1